MSAFKRIEQEISIMAPGAIISLDELSKFGSRPAVATALARLAKSNILVRIRRGYYMKPKESKYGVLPPSSDAVISALTQKGRKGYIAGLSAYNRLGLTTQVSNTIVLRGGLSNSQFKIGGAKIQIRAGKSPQAKKDIPLLMILDSLREIKLIPDSTLDEALRILKSKILELDKREKIRLIDLALDDKPVVRAILGAIIDEANPEITLRLLESLNPLTSYKIGTTRLSFGKKWKIK